MKTVDVLVVGAGPAGSAAAYYAAADAGLETLLIDPAEFPRDKTCGDGLTPRAIHSLTQLGLAEEILSRHRTRGLKLHGFKGSVEAPWPDSAFGTVGSTMRRRDFDELLRQHAIAAGAEFRQVGAVDVRIQNKGIDETILSDGTAVRAHNVIVADGVRSPFSKLLGRQWHSEHVYGIAARGYATSPRADEEWIHSHLELRDEKNTAQPGYGWVFPLADGTVNIGCGALSTTKRPASINTKKLLKRYADQVRAEWELGDLTDVASAMLPMGGAVSNVAGRNWMLIGDAAALVNPLNGEGIDYALESAQMAVSLLGEANYTDDWPELLREQYGKAFSLARKAALLLTRPRFLSVTGSLAMRGPLADKLMPTVARLMGNLVTDADYDAVASAWRLSGGLSRKVSKQLWGQTPVTL